MINVRGEAMNTFLNSLMELIIEGGKIPKVQVERAVAPILGMFIGELLTVYLKGINSDEYMLISQEFPLKKENNQSTNMDYLLANRRKDELVFVELKTDISSFDPFQAKNYVNIKNLVTEKSAKFLKENLLIILKNSTKKYKYEYLVKQFEEHISELEKIHKVLIVYIVPDEIKKDVQNTSSEIDYVLSFSDLPETINGAYSKEWAAIRKKLVELDHIQSEATEGDISYKNIIDNVESYAKVHKLKPLRIKLGNRGSRIKPKIVDL